ncbi:MAG TPA: hypothetical protein VH835_12965 [Dongiaceae bacterium]
MQRKFKEVSGGARQPESVRAQYEAYWSEVRGCVERVLACRPATLAHALRLIQRELAAIRPAKSRSLRFRRLAAVMTAKPLPPLAEASLYPMMARAMTADVVAEACDEQTRRIVELGSGWGANLFQLRSGGAPRDAEFVALEYTEAGREVTQMLAALDPAMKLSVRPFDYFRPDFSTLSPPLPTVVFSNHSIEQITRLGGAFFDALLAVPGLQRVVHIEPVGWQLRGGAEDLLSRVLPPTFSWRLDFRRRARRHRYNTDLIPLLRSLERDKRIVIGSILPDHIGANPLNPGTVIVWQPRR